MEQRDPKAGTGLRLLSAVAVVAALGGCENVQQTLGQITAPRDRDAAQPEPGTAPTTTRLVERDVEAPEIFQVAEAGLWDGRPSLGGVWVAHPDVSEPERVIIRNTANDRFVIGALFRRERDIPGPRIQASSDAAAALGMLAGAPVQLTVTALRREEVADTPRNPIEQAVTEATEPTRPPAPDTPPGRPKTRPETTATAQPPAPQPVATPAAPAPRPAPAPAASSLDKPYIQIGIFSVEANATRTASQMRAAGMTATVYAQNSGGKPFWRVVVGPAQTARERSTLLGKVREIGFTDAYAVTN
jgi:cell division septation protein DedD